MCIKGCLDSLGRNESDTIHKDNKSKIKHLAMKDYAASVRDEPEMCVRHKKGGGKKTVREVHQYLKTCLYI